eukprot:scaffold14369_cov18-Prasinocladus_malaysianus.AAC.1
MHIGLHVCLAVRPPARQTLSSLSIRLSVCLSGCLELSLSTHHESVYLGKARCQCMPEGKDLSDWMFFSLASE